jgi:hypothetical protein
MLLLSIIRLGILFLLVEVEIAYFVSLRFCVLDNNIRNFKCVLSGVDFTAQELARGADNPASRIIRPYFGRIIHPSSSATAIFWEGL